ncbi:hypothetical protein [Flavobacterium piscis]|uniref:Tetratricopeptide repeat protein n=1 Tax=Flavobacterium piscis TaxID=1114874 RepID=A0ABU1Y6C2_9FLAO|nr:hypothetical protein [Flavobacterium piscis]MDR7209683.1 hypothetical protein [Flavobacterium piscis]
MKRIFLSKLFLISSASLLFVYGIIYACGGGDDWDYFGYSSNFTPETFVDKSYSPLFLSGDIFYGIGFDTGHNSRFNDKIKSDWNEYLKSKVDTSAVSYFLIGDVTPRYYSDKKKSQNKTEITQLHVYFKTKTENQASLKWGKKINLKDTKVKSFIEFLYLAQKIEMVSIGDEYWSYDPVVAKTFDDFKMIQSIENVYNTTPDAFLKNRYWFLALKAYFYSSNKQKAIDFFNKTEQSVPKNVLYYRALSYVAGIKYQQKKYAESNYLYAVVFDKCPEMRIVTAYSFHPQNDADWNKSLAMAKNNKEKSALWAIHGYYKDEAKSIEKIYELDAKSEHLNYLLTRLVNKQEQDINNSFQVKNKSADYNAPVVKQTVAENKLENQAKLNKKTVDLVSKIATAENTEKPYLWDIALGYLQTLKGEFKAADTNFDKAEKIMPKTELAKYQLRLLRFVNNMSRIDKLTDKNEKTILVDLNWLYQELPKTYKKQEFRYQNAAQWSKNYLATLYKSNPVMEELFSDSPYRYWGSGNSFYDNEKNLLDMKAFLAKTNKTEIEKIAFGIYSLKLKDIIVFQSVKATFKNKIPEAIAFMKETDSVQYNQFLGNPFNGNIKDCHDCDHTAYQKKKYSQIDFLNTIKVMQDKLAQKEDMYTNSLLLGNAFYNITHFGNGRTFYEINIVGYGSSPYSFRDSMKKMITNCDVSKMYYQKAFEAASTKEQKAKCLYLMSKCERNQYYNEKFNTVNSWWEIQGSKVNFIAWSGFKTLKKDYSDTNYYQDVIAECGYFNTYVNQ